jgi:2-iminobutanoate/2-iminopropanoate deaminase
MEVKKEIKSKNAPLAIGPYSQGIEVANTVYISGQIPLTKAGVLVEGSDEEKVLQVMQNLENILKKANMTFENVVKTTIYITDMSIWNTLNREYARYFSKPYPARETVVVKELPKGTVLEVSMIAVR